MQRICIYDNCWLTWIELPVWGLHLKGDYHSTDDMTVDIGHVNYGNYPLVVKKQKQKTKLWWIFQFLLNVIPFEWTLRWIFDIVKHKCHKAPKEALYTLSRGSGLAQ